MPNTPPTAPTGEPTIAVTRQPRPGDNQPEDAHVTRNIPREKPFLMDDDWLMVRNDDTKPVEFAWNRKRWVIQPGEAKTVIFQALVNKLGDPRAVDDAIQHYDDGNGSRGQIRKRYEYMQSLFAMYGIREERITDFTNPETGAVIKGLESVVPRLLVETMEGYPVNFPAYDSKMLAFPVHSAKNKAVNSDVARALDEQSAENDYLRAELAKTNERIDALLNERQV